MTQKTFDVEHPDSHYPTDEQSKAALREALKADGQKLSGDVEFFHVETTSGGPSKVRATFESEPTAAAAKAETKPAVAKDADKTGTKTVGI